jgi:nitrate reductase gamma subunit
MLFCHLMDIGKHSGRARFILILITVMVLSGMGLLLSPMMKAANLARETTMTIVPTGSAAAQQAAASQLDFLANKSVVYGIPIVVAVAIYALFVFAKLSKKLAG